MLYGGDYNPEQWPRDVWKHDMRLLREASINEVTLNVFSWAALQPDEHTYDFSRLDDIVALVSEYGMNIIMATSTGALPAWMSLKYPDAERVDFDGRKHRHGARQNACPNSPTYRHYAAELASRLAERYGSLSNLEAWHISNEYEGICYCPNCARTYRDWLRARYGSVEHLNAVWGTDFWGHTYDSFDHIYPPDRAGDGSYDGPCAVLPAASLDYARFFDDSIIDAYNVEKKAIRRFDAQTPVTTNFMGNFYQYDYQHWAKDIDIAAWDCYPRLGTPASDTAFWHDLIRCLKRKPFLLMEQTPSRMNWMPYNALKRPGQMRQQSWQAIAHGADSVQFFQMRRSRYGCEKFHGAVIDADGTNKTRTFQEVAALGRELAEVGPLIEGSMPKARVAIIFDWSSWRGLRNAIGPSNDLDYLREARAMYAELYRRNIAVDVVGVGADFSAYDLVLAPALYIVSDADAARLNDYVRQGGTLVLTVMSALSDEHDVLHQGFTPAPFHETAGVWAMETDALAPDHTVPLHFADSSDQTDCAVQDASTEQTDYAARVLCDILVSEEGTQVLATYGEGPFYAGKPAITGHRSGEGVCYYAGAFLNGPAMREFLGIVLAEAGIPTVNTNAGVSINTRYTADGEALTFIINDTDEPRTVTMPRSGTDLLAAGTPATLKAGATAQLPPFGVMLLR
ncbi:beta-galactosidase [Bifidobacterium cebidarum]|uniref:Beta-galactosidase n=1 Tax=Bifidobacterium cebidarum TaxID=2650773 RepID=A0A6I1GAL1_9BIFI|nr:beta-galactosidase [Bifidobacterium cebidarum]KAB7788610.1 beta-galactosidase [Bifidobacterium cebidarum]